VLSPRRRAVAFALLLASLALSCSGKSGPPTDATLNGAGYTVHITASPFALRIVDASGAAKLETSQGPKATLDAHTYETQLIPGWDGYRSHEGPWTVATQGSITALDAGTVTLSLPADNGVTFNVTVSVDGPRVHYAQTVSGGRFNKSALEFALPSDSHFFGLGQRTASLDHLGLSLYSWAEEGGLGGGEDAGPAPDNPYPNGPSMTYFPVPFFHTTHGVSVLIDTTRRTETHFGTDTPDTWRTAIDDTSLALTFYVRDQPLDAIDDYTQDTGRPPIPAPWAFGPRRRINQGAQVDGGDEWQVMRDRKLPLTAIDDAMHSLPSYSQLGREASLMQWTQTLHAHGYKVMDYNNPYLSQSAANSAPDYAFGADAGFFETAPDGGPATTFFLSGGAQTISAIDLTNPAAVTWFQSLLQRSYDLGYDGWMHDFGEYVARSSHFADGRKGDEVHNAFPMLSAKAGFDFITAQRPGNGHFFTRSGYTGSQAYVLEAWGGDPEASFDDVVGLPAMLRGGLNLSMSGEPYWSSDTGGYKCLTSAPHDKEMLVRWYEMSAVSPMMHDEDACSNPINNSETKARLWDDTQTQDIYRTSAGLHTRLAPYFRALALDAHSKGTPITRHPFLLFPAQADAWAVEDSFFVGAGLYAAPVVRRGLTTRHVWLPPGRFVEWTERTLHTGPGFADVPAPLDRLPLFLVENTLVPLLDADVQTLATATDGVTVTETDRASVLDVIAVVGPSGTASFTLADGTQLTVKRLASDQGNPMNLDAATESTLPTCSHCALADQLGDVARVRMRGASGASDTVQFGAVSASSSGGPARLVRWEVLTLD
jgi:alpha-D-xyloside xylohydrolase